jgi:hypothetical protein
MELYGTLTDNLEAALLSVTRLRGQKVYPETISYWHELLDYARIESPSLRGRERSLSERLADQLERALSMRGDGFRPYRPEVVQQCVIAASAS